jgi:hypothetical protein
MKGELLTHAAVVDDMVGAVPEKQWRENQDFRG